MQISIFTDEISRKSPERAIEMAREWGVTHVEVRMFPDGRFPAVPDAELENFSKLLDDSGLKVSGVSPGFFKCQPDDPIIEQKLAEGLPKACEWIQRWGSDSLTCFGCLRDESNAVPQTVIDLVGRMADITQQNGCRLALENENVCWGNTGTEAAGIIRAVGSDKLTLCWDPGNSGQAGSDCPYPDEYESFKDLISHCHMKDLDPETRSWRLLGEGMIDWRGQLNALAKDGYDGFLVIETHLHIRPDEFRSIDDGLSDHEGNTFHNLEFVRRCLEEG
ncbi:sugar phosphate isomerase/epimerase family protein [Candidatus Hydrogenedentota bacterium]